VRNDVSGLYNPEFAKPSGLYNPNYISTETEGICFGSASALAHLADSFGL